MPLIAAFVEAAAELRVFTYLGIAERRAHTARGSVYATLVAIDPDRGIVSAHRTPDETAEYVKGLAGRGFNALPRRGIDVDPQAAALDAELLRTSHAALGPAARRRLQTVVCVQCEQVRAECFAQCDEGVQQDLGIEAAAIGDDEPVGLSCELRQASQRPEQTLLVEAHASLNWPKLASRR